MLFDNFNLKKNQKKNGMILPEDMSMIDFRTSFMTNNYKEKKMLSHDNDDGTNEEDDSDDQIEE